MKVTACSGQFFTVVWSVSFFPSYPISQFPPPAYQPFWVNTTVERDGRVIDSNVRNTSFNTNYTYHSIENATLVAAYIVTVSAVNQLGFSESITVDTKMFLVACLSFCSASSTSLECKFLRSPTLPLPQHMNQWRQSG